MHKSTRSWLILFLALALFHFLFSALAQSQSDASQRRRDTAQVQTDAAQLRQLADLLQSQQDNASQDGAGRELQRRNWFYQQRAYPLGYIPEGASQRAFEETEQAKAEMAAQASQVLFPGWFNIGPAPILGGQIVGTGNNTRVSGRVRDVTIDPTDSSHWMIATGGGVWETRDAGVTWIPKTDNQISLDVGAVAFAPSNPNIIYAGLNSTSRSGNGVLKSTDGGNTWHLLGTSTFANMDFFQFLDFKVHPTNPNILLVATWDFFFPPVVPTAVGIFKSTDGGVSWSRKLAGNGAELEVDPTNFNNQYAGIRTACPSTPPYNCDGSLNGVYRSTDAGETWQLINGPWGTIPNGGTSAGGSLELPIAPSNSNVLYAAIGSNNVNHVWRTTNAWAPTPSWVELPPNPGAEFSFEGETIVDASNANVLYSGSFGDLWKFDGATWTDITTGTHVDQSAMAWVGNRLILGNDGGIWSTLDGGNTWANHNTNLAITQFYRGSLHPTNPNFALGGSQDNGTEKWTGTNAWQFLFGGDGADNAVSSTNPATNWVVSFQFLGIVRTTDGGASFTGADSGIDKTGAGFIAPLKECPTDDNVFIAGTDNLWRTSNFFNSSSPSWATNGPEMRDGSGNSDGLSAIAFANVGTCSVYAFGTGTGQLRLTTDAGNTWRDLDPSNGVPNRTITDLAFDPLNANTLYLTLSGFDEGTPSQPGHVFKTDNALAAVPGWSNVSPPVNIPHNAIVLDSFAPNIVYVGTDLGVWKSTNGGSTWTMPFSPPLPNVPVLDLQIVNATHDVIAFTYGRGAFELVQPRVPDTVGLYNPGNGGFYLRNSNSPGPADLLFVYGPAGAGWIPLVGDWNGDGIDTVGLYNPTTSTFFLKNTNSAGPADLVFAYGPAGAGWIPLVGDWDGDGIDTVGLYNPATSTFFLKNTNSAGPADLVFPYGPAGAGWTPLVGDWDGDGIDTVGLFNPSASTFFLKNTNSAGPGDLVFGYGPGGAGWTPVVGDWNGDGVDTIGLYNPATGFFFLKNTNAAGSGDLVFGYGPGGAGWKPIVGDWDGL